MRGGESAAALDRFGLGPAPPTSPATTRATGSRRDCEHAGDPGALPRAAGAFLGQPRFAVSADKLPVIPLAGNCEFEAIRPLVMGSFANLLAAAVPHPAMLLYLDQAQSIGPAKTGWIARLLPLLPAADQGAIALARAVPLVLRGERPVATHAPDRLPQASDDLLPCRRALPYRSAARSLVGRGAQSQTGRGRYRRQWRAQRRRAGQAGGYPALTG